MLSNAEDLLLPVAVMQRAERAAMAEGISGWQMMEKAGKGAAEIIRQYYDKQHTFILCGPGNNGGDGYVIAQALMDAGWPVEVLSLGERMAISGDAATAAAAYQGPWRMFEAAALPEGLVVDALFGTGLTRPLEGIAKQVLNALKDTGRTVVAIDIPSGIAGDTGSIMGAAAHAEITITFGAKKLGHALAPGKEYSARVITVDIGIDQILCREATSVPRENTPALWQSHLPWPKAGSHKYNRGTVLVRGGEMHSTGASRLSAQAAQRAGAGAVIIGCSEQMLPIYAAACTSIMTKTYDEAQGFNALLEDERLRAILIGPGNGVNKATQDAVLHTLKSRKPLVLDADGLSIFADAPKQLFSSIESTVVMTPHEGEFSRLFSMIDSSKDKLSRAQEAASMSKAILVLKGADTVIAAPDGRAAINTNAPATLATAGSGDVLAGIVAGLIAQGMEPFLAACAGVWMHGEAASLFGQGLIAEDILTLLPGVLQRLSVGSGK